MKVFFCENGKNRSFALPNIIILNRLVLRKLKNIPGETEVPNISTRLLVELRKTIRQMRKIHKDWVFVEVHDQDGTHVIVKL